MATRIQLRRGTASSWTSADPILASGEVGIETDTNKIKIGDGSSNWTELDYFADVYSASAAIIAYIDSEIGGLIDSAPALLDTLNELAAAIGDDPSFFSNIRTTINSASATAYASASAYTNTQINALTTTDIEEGTRLYFTNQRALDATAGTIASASAYALSQANSYTNSASSSLVAYTDSEISALEVFSTIVTSPATQTVQGDSNSDSLTFVAGENISITAASATDSITINSTGNYTSVDSISYPDYIVFDTTPENTSASVSTLAWDSGESNLSVQLNANLNVGIGQEIIILANNGEATTLNKGEVVRLSGAQGQRPQVTRAYNTSDTGSALTIGIVAENITAGGEGFVVTQGIVKNINTNAFNEGDILYLSASAGVLTTVKPQAPNHYVFVGVVVKKNASSGRIYVKPQNGYELDELHNVRIVSEQNGDIIVWNSASTLWMNQPIQNYLNTASAAAFTSASAYTSSEIGSLTTNDIPEPTVAGNETFTVTNSGTGAYVVASVNNPTFTLVKGNTYTFIINASGHPFWIQSASGAYSSGNVYTTGTTNLGTDNGTITWTIPLNAPSTLYYACQFHSSMQGTINLINPGNLYFTHQRAINAASATFIPLASQQSIINSASAAAVTYLVDSAPGALDTLNELAAALNDDASFSTTVTNSLATKLNASTASATYLTQANASATYSVLGHNHTSSNITDFDEAAEDAVSSLFVHSNHTNITATYNDGTGQIVLVGSAGGGGSASGGGASIIVSASAPVGAVEGDAWFDNTDGSFYVFDGTFWVETAPEGSGSTDGGSFTRWSKTYSGSATLISGTDDNLFSLNYTPGLEQLFINGILQDPSNYTATSGSSIVVNEAVVNNDVVEVVAVQSFNIANAYTKAEIDQKVSNYTRWTKTLGASATTISGLDDDSLPLTYTVGNEEVFINGILLTNVTDYTATSGSTIVLTEAAFSGDIVEVKTFETINVANLYTQTQADAKFITNASASSTYYTKTEIDTLEKGPAFFAYRTSTQSVTAGVTTKVQLNGELFDTHGCFDSTTNYRFTPTVAGYYQFNATLGIFGNNGSQSNVEIRKNGSTNMQVKRW